MERSHVRGIAAIVAGAITFAGIHGITAIARYEAAPAMPVVVMERVEVVAAKPAPAESVLAEVTSPYAVR